MPKKQAQYEEIRLILGDQLNPKHPWFDEINNDVLFVLMEVRPESEYVTHHIQKITAIFGAMRRFAEELKAAGHATHYFSIDADENRHDFAINLEQLAEEHGATIIRYQEPDEWRLDALFRKAGKASSFDWKMDATAHFYTERNEMANFFAGKKQFLMESFYRYMRKKHGVLMDGSEPVSGRWNYDQENRKRLPKGHLVPEPLSFHHDITEELDAIEKAEIPHFGAISAKDFLWPLDRTEAIQLLEFFIADLLPRFGKYQDALSDTDWSLYHSRLSFALNVKMLAPKEVVEAAESAWREDPERVSLAQAEGFIRQILGWREYMRGIYWSQMPGYAEKNFFDHHRKLPEYFWTGETKMRCVGKAVKQSLEKAYAHHIQRLMVTGNFALLAGIDPDAVDQWYLGIYIDAFEWVEITNTRGMSQYADGGIVGTKPYVSSGSYINKMGDHCAHCTYDPKVQTGENACPFNSLYWNFLAEHRSKLENNRRMGLMYRVWDKFSTEKQTSLQEHANDCLNNLDSL